MDILFPSSTHGYGQKKGSKVNYMAVTLGYKKVKATKWDCENNINVRRRPVSSVRIRFDNHKEIRTFLTHIAPCKRTHCWPTTPNIVGCHMLRPFARPVACSCCCSPKLFIWALVMFLNRVFRQEWFNRSPWFLASLIKNGRTLRKCYLFSCRYKNVWDIGICLKPHFYKKCQ